MKEKIWVLYDRQPWKPDPAVKEVKLQSNCDEVHFCLSLKNKGEGEGGKGRVGGDGTRKEADKTYFKVQ